MNPHKMHIEHLKKLPGGELLDRYQGLDPDHELLIELHQRAIIEKYADEIGYSRE